MCVTHKGIISFRVMSTGELWSLLTRLVPQVPGAERAAIIHRSVVNLALLVRISVVESCWPVALKQKMFFVQKGLYLEGVVHTFENLSKLVRA